MQKTFCDICGKETNSYNPIVIEYRGERRREKISPDLCVRCYKDLLELLEEFLKKKED